MEYFRAQPIASSRRVVKNDASFAILLPLQGTVVPDVNEAHHQHTQKDDHFDQARRTERAVDDRPWIEEDELDVEEDEKDRGQIKLDRQPSDRERERNFSALERREFIGRGILLSQRGAENYHQRRDPGGHDKTHGDPEILAHDVTPRPVYHRRHHGDTVQDARLPGAIPPIKVTSAATANPAKVAARRRNGSGSSGLYMYMKTTTRM